MISCIIIEDQAPAQRVLKKYISDDGRLDLQGSFTNIPEALHFLQTATIDLVFLDIHLPQVSGIEVLRSGRPFPNVILTTAFSDYALEGFEHGVVDYLLKPFSYERFVKAVSRLVSLPATESGTECMIKSGHEYIKFNSRDVLYIRTDMDYAEIHLTDRKLLSKETLTHWEQILKPHAFVRIHKSYLVNLSHVQKLASAQVWLSDETVLPIGRAYKDQVLERWSETGN